MSLSSTSSSPRPSRATQPSCAQLDASYSPARLASRNTSEDEDSDSSVSRLLRQEANDSDTDVNIDGDSGQGAEDNLETAHRRRRSRVTEYIPCRRNHGELGRRQQPAFRASTWGARHAF
ncbi:uncharacterized protein CPUR_01897 [Claviceps purpurea 20.1]|uniref:Uncharacterized protein n=1 Tax=Claviceps purpurea (strain 20.1) TaxID=1111077 RepID=M1VUV3_CLAP2|nr:uncharacterized protein CPUR_01897 [Claviceps purpurea 20.1]